jgi:DNA repair protein RecN (Recombination protein N)
MLLHLNISNFAIIKDLEITLRPGLNILSGETGAGKSIIINAVNLILGGRASADLIRSGCEEARVEALFSFPDRPFFKDLLSELGFPFEGELLIKRTIFREGRNRIFINDSMATLQVLSRLGSLLISISGQHEHQLLIRPENHLYVLDDFGGLTHERLGLGSVFNRYQRLHDEIKELEQEILEIGAKQELSRFQIQEIERAGLSSGEDDALQDEKHRLQHAEDLLEMVSKGYETLYEGDGSVLSSISRCTRSLEQGAKIDPRLGSVRDALAEIEARIEDAAFTLRDLRNATPVDPDRLEEVMERLEFINTLKRKYGPTLDAVLKFKDTLTSDMGHLDEKRERRDHLVEERQAVEGDLTTRAQALSEKRGKAAGRLGKAVEKELKDLHMAETRFEVRSEPLYPHGKGRKTGSIDGITEDGADRVEFMISPNIGEDLRPMAKIASGGELSRVMLAAKTILARTGSVETIIFDEVDSGISGATAQVVGEKLLSLARYHQMLCITHLPQIASQGQTHFLVKKEVIEGRTQTLISELEPGARVREIARLLGGRKITPSAVAHAKEMLAKAGSG